MTAFLIHSAATITNATLIVDSSKLISRGWLYIPMAKYGVEAKFIHLVRDGARAIGSSSAHPDPGSTQSAPRRFRAISQVAGTLEWVYHNAICSIAGNLLKNRYMRVRYEDFIRNPVATLNRIGRFLDIDVEAVADVMAEGGRLARGHVIAGNRAKFDPMLKFDPDAEESSRPMPAAPLSFRVLGGWLQKSYGYRPEGGIEVALDPAGPKHT